MSEQKMMPSDDICWLDSDHNLKWINEYLVRWGQEIDRNRRQKNWVSVELKSWKELFR